MQKTRKESLLNAQESCSDRVASQPETPPQRRLRGRTRPPKGTSGDSSQILNAKGQVWASQQSPVGSTDEGRGSPLRGRSTVCVLQAVHRPATGEHFLRGCSCCRRTRDPPSKIRNGSHIWILTSVSNSTGLSCILHPKSCRKQAQKIYIL